MADRNFTLEEAESLLPVLESLLRTAIDGKKIFVCKGFFRPCAESRFLLSRVARLYETVYEMISPADVFGG